MVRCPACRGAKKVMKLGGLEGDCNTCLGKGEIAELKPFVAQTVAATKIKKPKANNGTTAST